MSNQTASRSTLLLFVKCCLLRSLAFAVRRRAAWPCSAVSTDTNKFCRTSFRPWGAAIIRALNGDIEVHNTYLLTYLLATLVRRIQFNLAVIQCAIFYHVQRLIILCHWSQPETRSCGTQTLILFDDSFFNRIFNYYRYIPCIAYCLWELVIFELK